MPSTYSTNLKIELMATGENSGTWGTVTNTNLGTALEQAVVGYGNPDFVTDANLTITLSDSNSLQAARALVLNVTSTASLTVTRELIVPTIQKQYIVQNNTSGSQSITVKTSAGTGVTIPNGKKMHVYVNGTDVVQMDDFALIFNVDNLTLDGNTLSSTNTNGNIVLAPNGTGDVQLDADTVRVGDSNVNVTITSNGTADLILNTNAGTNSGAITIQDGVDGNIIIAPNGNGQVQISNAALDLTTIEVTNIKAKDGTASITLADSTGQATFSANPLLNAGTANGVAFLNGSKVLTTGSVLTFDGTNFATTGAGTFSGILSRIHAQGTDAYITNTTTGKANTVMGFNDSGSTTAQGIPTGYSYYGTLQSYPIGFTSGGYLTNTISSTAHVWNTTGSEQMRLTSTGLGIGTSSPAEKLHVNSGAGNVPALFESTDPIAVVQFKDNNSTLFNAVGVQTNSLIFYSGDNLNMRLDSSGNLGLGVTPSAWTSTHKAYQLQGGGSLYNNGADGYLNLANNFYYDGADWRRVTAAPASTYLQSSSGHLWGYVGTGTANSVCGFPSSQMALDASGNLGLGVTPSAWSGFGKTMEFNNAGCYVGNSGSTSMQVGANNYFNGSNYIYSTSNVATRYAQFSGQHQWFNAPSGTANSAVVAASTSYTVVALGTTTLGEWQASFNDASNNPLTVTPTLGQVLTSLPSPATPIPNGGLVTQNISFTQAMTLDASGNLLVGGTSTAALDGVSGIVAGGSGKSTGGIAIESATSQWLTYTDSNQAMIFYDARLNTERARISSDGTFRVKGAGTAGTTDAVQFSGSAPASAMTLDASGNLQIGTPSSGGAYATFGNSSVAGANRWAAVFGTNSVSAGNPSSFGLTVGWNYSGGGGENNIIYGLAAGSTPGLAFSSYNGTTIIERARITSGGYFKASFDGSYMDATGTYHEFTGTTANGYTLKVRCTNATPESHYISDFRFTAASPNNSTALFIEGRDSTAARFELRSNGGLANYQANDANLSDQRVKKDIVAAPSYWNKIKGIEIVHFKYKDQTHDDNNVGVIAQQVEQVAPEFVDQNGWGDTPEDGVPLKSIYTSDMHHAAIKALQEAMARIEKLEAEVAALKGA